jgi:hypothetical protein
MATDMRREPYALQRKVVTERPHAARRTSRRKRGTLPAMHRSLSGTAAAAVLLALGLAAPAAHAADPIMPLTDVRAGMQCTALTVISGLEPVSFDATVISVEGGPRPVDAGIVMRFSGDAVANGGIAEGFSGSPVYCPDPSGVMRNIGAVAYGIGQYDNLVGQVTPIEAMLAEPTSADAPSAPLIGNAPATSASKAKSKKSATAAVATTTKTTTAATDAHAIPLTLSGPRGALASVFSNAAAKAGKRLLVSPLATRAQAPAGGLKAGDAVAATQVYGDVSAGAIGTVTYVDGDKIYAFGHPFNGTGAARLQLERAQISTVINSPTIADQASYKLGSAVGPVGTINFDGVSGVAGLLGAAPPSIPVGTTIKDAGGTVIQQATANVIDERAVRGGGTADLLGLGAAANAGTALQRLTTQSAIGGSARACTTIFLKNNEKPLSACVDTVVARPTSDGGVETGVADAVAAAVAPATSVERFLKLVDHVQTDITFRKEADDAEIVKIIAPKHPKAGSSTTVRVVVVQGSTGDRREIPVKVRIPRSGAGHRTGIVIVPDAIDALAPSDGSSDPTSIDELFADDSDTGEAPKTLDALRALYTTAGISGLRAIVAPGIGGADIRAGINGDDSSNLDDTEVAELMSHAKLVWQLPSVLLSGGASVTVTPRR